MFVSHICVFNFSPTFTFFYLFIHSYFYILLCLKQCCILLLYSVFSPTSTSYPFVLSHFCFLLCILTKATFFLLKHSYFFVQINGIFFAEVIARQTWTIIPQGIPTLLHHKTVWTSATKISKKDSMCKHTVCVRKDVLWYGWKDINALQHYWFPVWSCHSQRLCSQMKTVVGTAYQWQMAASSCYTDVGRLMGL